MSRPVTLLSSLLPALVVSGAVGFILIVAALVWLPAPSTATAPSATGRPSGGPIIEPSFTPAPAVATAAPLVAGTSVATRIVISRLHIDLPIVSGDLVVNGQPNSHFPYCDVAQYLTTFSQPGRPGTTYVYAHARLGMFWPLLLAARTGDDALLLGMPIEVYSSDGSRRTYVITVVKRHAVDFSLARALAAGGQQLILQTSEGPSGTYPKLQLAATLTAGPVDVGRVAAVPVPHPRPCL